MTTLTLAERARSSVNAEGFFTDPEQWTEEMADEIAARERHRRADRPPLAGHPLHAQRRTWRTASAPSIRTLGKARASRSRSSTSCSPKGPAKLAAKIAGIPKPRGCI